MAVTTSIAPPTEARAGADLRPVRLWLAATLVLVFAMIIVGGATRLTDSGLSITEWKPIHGAIPPLSEAAWQAEFQRYRQTSQYDILNRGMEIGAFKRIYWWEWGHRQLGRLIGLVYLGGFLWFALTRRVSLATGVVLFAMGLLLATQGLVGWIMVASGLEPGMTAVAPVKLTLHLTLACLFFASLVWMIARLGGAGGAQAAPARRPAAAGIVGLVFVQIALGGLVAGHDAGLTYNTWPLMDGRFIPTGLALLDPLWLNFFGNVTTIQFTHRLGAYVLGAAVLAYAALTWRGGAAAARSRAGWLLALVLAQIALGVLTLIQVVPLGLALAHQALALVLLGAAVWNLSAVRRQTAP